MAISSKIESFLQSSSLIRKMFEEGAKLKAIHGVQNVCDFSIGNPDVPPPPEFQKILEEESLNTDANIHGYMPNAGYLNVRSAIADYINKEQKSNLENKHVIMTTGAGGALNVILKSILNPGDEVLVSVPYFVEYKFYCDNHGGILKTVPCTDDFDIDVDQFEKSITDKCAAVIINSPNNPSGKIYPEKTLKKFAEVLRKKSSETGRTIYLISDEPYRKIVYDGVEVPGIFGIYSESMICTSYSKDLSLPGERIGWLAINPSAENCDKIINAAILCNRILGYVNAPALMQRVVGRLQGVKIDVNVYKRKRDALCGILDENGYDYFKPEGTFYLFVKSPDKNESAFVELLKQNLILTVPGSAFGVPGYFRISYCTDDSYIDKSAEGFKNAMNEFMSGISQ
ncbi:MAG: pyridoxal phosphate-dependent aminotransferase [Spirochaetes bacterium]|nr:pyridoxal phosphate-dependent aminotransferase [Spirochaetota bacterium]